MTRTLLLIVLMPLLASPATAGDLSAGCCEPPPSRSGAKVWFRSDSPERLAVAVARGPSTDTQGFMAAAGLALDVGDGCGPVAMRPRVRSVSGW